MKKRAKKILLWGVLLAGLFGLTNFTAHRKYSLTCQALQVHFVNHNHGQGFIRKQEVITKMETIFPGIIGTPLDSLPIQVLENGLREMPHVQAVKVYKTMTGELSVNIREKAPVARILPLVGSGYYIDEQGCYLPLSGNHSANVLVFTGHIDGIFWNQCVEGNKVEGFKKLMGDIYELAQFIQNEAFWYAQIQQVNVNENLEFQLIPRVGNHIIELGKLDAYRTKLKKLRIFYNEGLRYSGWNQYKKIDLRFKDQVVCTKK